MALILTTPSRRRSPATPEPLEHLFVERLYDRATPDRRCRDTLEQMFDPSARAA
jgi:hypothetical protein